MEKYLSEIKIKKKKRRIANLNGQKNQRINIREPMYGYCNFYKFIQPNNEVNNLKKNIIDIYEPQYSKCMVRTQKSK